jgi:glutathione reductase (NADPH)
MIDVTPEQSPMPIHYDYIAIGGGSAGVATAKRAAEYGARVAVIEPHRLGGTCVNVGCVPKKIMWIAATLAHAAEDAHGYGFDLVARGHDWAKLKAGRDAYVAHLNELYAMSLASKGIDWKKGHARFIDAGTLAVGDELLTAPHIVIATGGRPHVPDLPGAARGITSDGFFELAARPARVAVVGSGYVAVELGGVFAALGSRVTMFARQERLLRSFDVMLSNALAREMTADGILLVTHAVPAAVHAAGAAHVLELADGRRFGDFDCVLWAIGRGPVSDALGLERAGVARYDDGGVITDRFQNTNVAGVYALGDVTGREALTPVAIAAGRRLADRLFGGQPDRFLDYALLPTVVFSHPPIGAIGITEVAARELHGDAVRVHTASFVPMHHALAERRRRAEMKLVCVGADERIVGLHVIGAGADEMLQGFAVAVKMGACKRDFDDTVAIHPTAAEELVTMR